MPPSSTYFRNRTQGPIPSLIPEPLYSTIRGCTACSLHTRCRGPVPPVGPLDAPIVFVGEAPGANEDEWGIPFTGNTWEEMESLFRIPGLTRERVWLSNVLKCKPPGDPKLADADVCAPLWLEAEIKLVRPRLIVAMGQIATRYLLGDPLITMEESSGYAREDVERGTWILPIYHPAAGFHQAHLLPAIRSGFEAIRDFLHGRIRVSPVDAWGGSEDYVDQRPLPPRTVQDTVDYLRSKGQVSVDTETTPDRRLWCFSVSSEPGEGFVFGGDQVQAILPLVDGSIDLTFHNASYDLPRLRETGLDIRWRTLDDTMMMARNLQLDTAALKPLMRRLLGMKHRDYNEVVGRAARPLMLVYLAQALEISRRAGFPEPVPFTDLQWDKAEHRLVEKHHKPQPLSKKVLRLLKDMAEEGENAEEPTDARKRWMDWSWVETKPVVDIIGPPPIAYLTHVAPADAVWYSARDADGTQRLRAVLLAQLAEADLVDIYRLDMGALPMFIDMMMNGMAMDVGYARELEAKLRGRIAQLEYQSWGMAGRVWNPNSDDQKRWVLYDHLGLPKPNRITPGGSVKVDDDSLKPLEDMHPIVPVLLEQTKLEKLVNTYVGPIPKLVDPAGRLHYDYGGMALSGRATPKNPNVGAIPKRSKEGKEYRNSFVAPPGRKIVSADYDQVELRVLADVADDHAMQSVFIDGAVDIHTRTASLAFSIPANQITKDSNQRRDAKVANFGWAYDITAKGLLVRFDGMGIKDYTEYRCQEFLTACNTAYPDVVRWKARMRSELRRYGQVWDMWGRRRVIPEIYSSRRQVQEGAEREAINHPIQAGAQGIIKKAMGEIQDKMDAARLHPQVPGAAMWRGVDWLIQVHDDLTCEMDEPVLAEAIPAVQRIMEGVVVLKVPLLVSITVGDRLGELE